MWNTSFYRIASLHEVYSRYCMIEKWKAPYFIHGTREGLQTALQWNVCQHEFFRIWWEAFSNCLLRYQLYQIIIKLWKIQITLCWDVSEAREDSARNRNPFASQNCAKNRLVTRPQITWIDRKSLPLLSSFLDLHLRRLLRPKHQFLLEK